MTISIKNFKKRERENLSSNHDENIRCSSSYGELRVYSFSEKSTKYSLRKCQDIIMSTDTQMDRHADSNLPSPPPPPSKLYLWGGGGITISLQRMVLKNDVDRGESENSRTLPSLMWDSYKKAFLENFQKLKYVYGHF